MTQEPARASAVDEASSDGELVIALQQKKSAGAFEVLVRRYHRPLYGFIARQLGDPGRAEDLFQQTAMQIYARIDSCASPEAFKAWAFGIAANACRNHERSERLRAVEPYSAEKHGGAAAVGPDPEQAALDQERRDRIASALKALPPAQREVFILYHYTQLSYDEIAQALGIPTGTVKSRMNAALTQLRTLLAALKPSHS